MIVPEDMTPERLRQIASVIDDFDRLIALLSPGRLAPPRNMQVALRRWASQIEKEGASP